MQIIKKVFHKIIRSQGYEIRKPRPADVIEIPKYLSPSAHKLYDFREEPGFSDVAHTVIGEGRTLLDFDRLLVLWQAVRNTRQLEQPVSEVGSYRGGSARFLSSALSYFGSNVPLHIFDTFSGHPDQIYSSKDGPHQVGLFNDTSLDQVSAYLSGFKNMNIHDGRFEDRCADIADLTFGLVHIDVDIYQSTLSCLDFFWPRLVPSGVMVIDDYGFTTCQGLKEAVDSFIAHTSDCHGWYMHTGQFVIEKVRSSSI
jgi:hypothetical protein